MPLPEIASPEYFKLVPDLEVMTEDSKRRQLATELARLIPALEQVHGELRIPRRDLDGYLFLQYGADRQVVADTVTYLQSRQPRSHAKRLGEKLEQITDTDRLEAPLRLGRVLLPDAYEVATSFWQFLASPQKPSNAFHSFVYRTGFALPRPDAILSFQGREHYENYYTTPIHFLDKVSGESGGIREYYIWMSTEREALTRADKAVAAGVEFS